MELKSINNNWRPQRRQLKIKLLKCGNQRNPIENYHIDQSRLEEEKYINIINMPYYESMKEAEKMWERGEQIIGDKEAIKKLLKCHPFPRYQGPFNNMLNKKMYEFTAPEEDTYTFESYTTFKHEDLQPCQVWEVSNHSDDKLKLHLLFNAHPVTVDHMLSGPASKHDMAIMYTCQKGKCVIVCPCIVCSHETHNCKRRCGSNPCVICSTQCLDHHIDLPRKYNSNVDSFTIPCYSQQFDPPRVDPTSSAITNCSDGHQYAGIPRKCDKCRLDLLDHQIHHHVLHDRCKFCKVQLRTLDKEVTVKLWKNKDEIKQTDMRTCGFCYKVFQRMKQRKLHELLTHKQDGRMKRFQCEKCIKNFASKTALKYHSKRTHASEDDHYSCNKCSLEFKSELTLKRHINNIHEDLSWNECDLCTKKIKRKDKLTRHKRDAHKEANVNHHYTLNSESPSHLEYQFTCELCNKRFKRKENAKRHEKLGSCEKNEVTSCHKCEMSFNRIADLRRHEETLHRKAMNVKCLRCSKLFTRRDNMLKHLKQCKI